MDPDPEDSKTFGADPDPDPQHCFLGFYFLGYYFDFAWWQKDPDPHLILMEPDPDPGGPKTYLRIRIRNTTS